MEFNDRAIPASQRYPDEPQTGQAENTGSVTIRRGSYLWLTTEKKLNALRERILGNRTNFDMARHIDDQVERCQEDFQRDHNDKQVVPTDRVVWDGQDFRVFSNRDPGDEHEDGRRFTNRNA